MEQNLLKTLAEEIGALRVDNLYKDLVIDELNHRIEVLSGQVADLMNRYEPTPEEPTEVE